MPGRFQQEHSSKLDRRTARRTFDGEASARCTGCEMDPLSCDGSLAGNGSDKRPIAKRGAVQPDGPPITDSIISFTPAATVSENLGLAPSHDPVLRLDAHEKPAGRDLWLSVPLDVGLAPAHDPVLRLDAHEKPAGRDLWLSVAPPHDPLTAGLHWPGLSTLKSSYFATRSTRSAINFLGLSFFFLIFFRTFRLCTWFCSNK